MAVSHLIIVWFLIWEHRQKPYILIHPVVPNPYLDGQIPPKYELNGIPSKDGKLSSLFNPCDIWQ